MGLSLNVDGSEDHLIKPEGIPGYKVDPPARIANNQGQDQEIPEGQDPTDENEEAEEEEEEVYLEADEEAEVEEDNEQDQDYDHPDVGKHIKALYEAGKIISFL